MYILLVTEKYVKTKLYCTTYVQYTLSTTVRTISSISWSFTWFVRVLQSMLSELPLDSYWKCSFYLHCTVQYGTVLTSNCVCCPCWSNARVVDVLCGNMSLWAWWARSLVLLISSIDFFLRFIGVMLCLQWCILFDELLKMSLGPYGEKLFVSPPNFRHFSAVYCIVLAYMCRKIRLFMTQVG